MKYQYENTEAYPTNRNGKPQQFKTVILAKGSIGPALELKSQVDWINKEREWFRGNIIAHVIAFPGLPAINAVNLYSPAWPIDRERLEGIDTQGIQLENNPDVWCTEILWSALINTMAKHPGPWVVGGDFNSSETFDAWRAGGRGNRQIIERFNALGLYECLRTHHGRLVPTFRNARGGAIVHQMDHLYVSEPLLGSLRSATVGPAELILDQGLSDHLPIIADFDLPPETLRKPSRSPLEDPV